MARKMLIQVRRDTAANWTSANPTLAAGEPGFETDTGKFKFGDGTTAWSSLAYFQTGAGSGDVATDLIWDTKGDIAVASGSNAADNLPVGSSGQVLTADPGETLGVKWATPTSGGGGIAGSPELIYRYTVTGSDRASIDTGVETADAGSLDWASGDVLEVFMLMRTDNAAATASIDITVNNDTSSIYDLHRIRLNNTSLTGTPVAAAAAWQPVVHGSGGSTGYPAALKIIIPGYADTTFWKVGTFSSEVPDQTAGNTNLYEGNVSYRSTSAITRLKVSRQSSELLKVGSKLLIYKRKSTGALGIDGGSP